MKITFKINRRKIFTIIAFFALFLIVYLDMFDGSTESQKLLGLKANRIPTAKEKAKAVNKGKKNNFNRLYF